MNNGVSRNWKKVSLFLLVLSVLVAITGVAIFLVPVAPGHTDGPGPKHRVCKSYCQSAIHADNTWVQVKSTSPADIRSAAVQTELYQMTLHSHNDPLGNLLRQGTPGTPVLVYPYRDDAGLDPVWELPILRANKVIMLMQVDYDPTRNAVSVGDMGPVAGFNFNHPFPLCYQSSRYYSRRAARAQGCTDWQQGTTNDLFCPRHE